MQWRDYKHRIVRCCGLDSRDEKRWFKDDIDESRHVYQSRGREMLFIEI